MQVRPDLIDRKKQKRFDIESVHKITPLCKPICMPET